MKPICFRSYRAKYSGYGYGTEEFLKIFRKAGLGFTFQNGLEKTGRCREQIVIHSGFPHFYRLEKGRVNIARVMLESDSLPRLWVEILNSMDEVWVASSFNARTFSASGVNRRKIFVIPDIVDSRFLENGSKRKRRGKVFRFLSVFLDLSLRKGWDLMLFEFLNNFAGNRQVEWVVQCSAHSAQRLRYLLKTLSMQGIPVANIRIMGKRPTASQMVDIYHSADCYVLPTRGEGFGRPYLEAASCRLPVIATGFGGQLDFLNRKNSRLLKYRLVTLPAPGALDCCFLACQRWAEPSGKDIGLALMEALDRPEREPVDLEPFGGERVMKLIGERLDSVKKTSRIKKFDPQIICYDAKWKGSEPSPKAFVSGLKKIGKSFAIVGTGRNAASLTAFLIGKGFDIPFYIDRKSGRFKGRKVYTLGGLKEQLKADAVILSCYPAAFDEWKGKLAERIKNILPVIFYTT